MAVTAALAETISFDKDQPGSGARGLAMASQEGGIRTAGRTRRRRADETQCAEAERPRAIPWCVKNDASVAMAKSKSSSRLYLERTTKLAVSSGAGRTAITTTSPGLMRWKTTSHSITRRTDAQHDQVRRCPGSTNAWHTLRVEFFGKACGLARRQALYRDGGRAYYGWGGRLMDESRQRNPVRRFYLRPASPGNIDLIAEGQQNEGEVNP